LIGAWLAVGGQLLDEENFHDTVEETTDGVKRQVIWSVKGDVPARINGEEVNFEEFRRRWLSDEWRAQNPLHWITIQRAQRDHTVALKTWLQTQKPCALIRKGNRYAVIHPDLAPERKAKILSQL
jgi:phage FluMu gp28-like protein